MQQRFPDKVVFTLLCNVLNVKEDDMKLVDKKGTKQNNSWSGVKKVISNFGHEELVNLIANLYHLSSDNKNFFHARFSVGEDPLSPYKKIIEDCLYPDMMHDKPLSIAQAKKAVSQYEKAIGERKGLLELRLYFVECGNKFTVECGDINQDFYLAMVRMYGKAIDTLLSLDEDTIQVYQPRFRKIMESSSGIGWGYHDDLCDLYYEAFSDFEELNQ